MSDEQYETFTRAEIIEAFRRQWPHIDVGEKLEPYEQGILDDLLDWLDANKKGLDQ